MAKMMGTLDKRGAADALKPAITTYYIKGNRMRTDESDGDIRIVDLDARTITEISPADKTYGVIGFDELNARAQLAEQYMAQDPQLKNASLTFKPTFVITPQPGTRVILGQTAKEVKARLDTSVEAQSAGNGGSGSMSMNLDIWIAPGVTDYQEIREFERKMSRALKVPPPGGMRMDPRARQGLSEVQKADTLFNTFPLL